MKKLLHIIGVMMVAALLLGGVVTVPVSATSSEWSVPMAATTDTEGSNTNLEFGTSDNATAYYDSGVDIPHPPPGPGATFDAYFFIIIDPIFPQLDKDCRAPAENIAWKLYVKSTSEEITLTWDTSGVPADISLTLSGAGQDIDMKTVPSTVLNAGDHKLTITSIVVVNSPPVADAGPDQNRVVKGREVTLDGSNSSDADDDPLTYLWTQTGGASVSLSDQTAVNPTFTPPVSDNYTFSLVVNDGTDDSPADEVVIDVRDSNNPPVLSNGKVVPSSGDTSTKFTYSVKYTDADNDSPISITVTIDGGTPKEMTVKAGQSDNYTSGVIYQYTVNKLAAGNHNFKFAASDGMDDATESHTGPDVSSGDGGGGGGGGGGGMKPGVTSVSDYVTSQGKFRSTVIAKSEDGMVILTIYKDTIGKTASGGRLSRIEIFKVEDTPPPPEGLNIVGLAYSIGPHRATFVPAALLTIIFDPDSLEVETTEKALSIAVLNAGTGEWIIFENCVVDLAAHTVSVPLDHLSTYTILMKPPEAKPPAPPPSRPASFTVSDLDISPAEVIAGESVTISVKVRNTGGLAGSYTVRLNIDGEVEKTEEISLSAGESKIVSFTVTRDTAGSYEVEIAGQSRSFTVTELPEPAAFSISNLVVSPDEVIAGEPVTISVKVTNVGGTEGSYTVRLRIDSKVEETREITLAAGTGKTISFTVTKETAGSYDIEVADQSIEFKVLPKPLAINWPLIGGIIAAIVVIGLVTAFLLIRRVRTPAT